MAVVNDLVTGNSITYGILSQFNNWQVIDSAHSIESQLREEIEDNEATLSAIKTKLNAARQSSSALALTNIKLTRESEAVREENDQLRHVFASLNALIVHTASLTSLLIPYACLCRSRSSHHSGSLALTTSLRRQELLVEKQLSGSLQASSTVGEAVRL